MSHKLTLSAAILLNVAVLLLIFGNNSKTLKNLEPRLSSTIAIQIQKTLLDLGDTTTCSQSCPSCQPINSPSNHSNLNGSIPFFFLHIPKTGGVSVELDCRALACPGPNNIKTNCFCGRSKEQFHRLFQNKWKYRGDDRRYGWRDFSVFCGHMAWGLHPQITKETTLLQATVLRNPIHRAISHWNMNGGYSYGFNNIRNVSFQEAASYSLTKFGPQTTLGHEVGSAIRNEQVMWLCGVNCAPSMPLEQALELSIAHLLQTSVVAIQEDMNGLLTQLKAVLPWFPRNITQFSRRNVRSSRRNVRQTRYSELTREQLTELQEFLWADFQLYDVAVKLSRLKQQWLQQCPDLARERGCAGLSLPCLDPGEGHNFNVDMASFFAHFRIGQNAVNNFSSVEISQRVVNCRMN
eukprot:gene1593-3075_t